MRRCWVNFQCRGVLLIWTIVGQGPIALAVGAGGGCLDIFSLVYLFSFFLRLWETARYRLKYCLKGPLNQKQPTNQSVSQLLAKHSVQVRRGRVDIDRDQDIVERFNRTLAERLFGHKYAQEMRLPSGEQSTEWAKRLPSVVAALNEEVTQLTDKKPSDAIKANTPTQKPSSVVPGRPLGLKEQNVPSGVGVRYLYQPGELEGGRRRATDPVWSLEVYRLGRSVTKPGEGVVGWCDGPG